MHCKSLQTHQKKGGALMGFMVPARKQAAHKLSGIKGCLSSSKRVPRPLYRPECLGGNRQNHCGFIHKQGRRHEVGPTLCPTVENPDLVYQKTSNSQSSPHPRPAECGSRQAIQAGPDHSNRVVSPSRSFPGYMQQVALASNRPVCHEVQQQVASVCVTSTGSPGNSGGCTHSTLGGFGRICFPTGSHLGQSVEKLQDTPCKRVILIAPGWPNMLWFWDLVTMSSQIPLCLPNLFNLLTQPFNQTPHRNLANLNLHAWLLEPQQSRSKGSLRQWRQELRLLKCDQLDQSMRQNGPFLQNGASLIRWTSGHHL